MAQTPNSGFTHRRAGARLGPSGNLLVGHGGCEEAEAQPPVPVSQVRKPAAVRRKRAPKKQAARPGPPKSKTVSF